MIRRWTAAVAMVALAGCGVDPRPVSSARPVAPAPAYVVAIPVPAPRPRPRDSAPAPVRNAVQAMVRQFPGIAGVAIRAVDEGWTIEANARRRMPQQSVSKFWVALTALEFLVAALQAYVFTVLTCIYLNDAIHPGH